MAEMWFGVRGAMSWVPCPAVNMGMGKVGWASTTQLLGGGAYVRRSVSAHKVYNMSWNLTTRERIRRVTDYADGVYGTGYVYWSDPFVNDTNVMPMAWSVPSQGAHDGPVLNGGDERPTLVPTSANTWGYPVQSAVYDVDDTVWRPEVWIPIPPGYVAHVGWHGDSSGGGYVGFHPTVADVALPVITATALSTSSSTLVNASIDTTGGIDGVLVKLEGTGEAIITAITVQILKAGVTPQPGRFISGQGNAGCDFEAQPSVTGYSAAMDMVGATATLIEVGGLN